MPLDSNVTASPNETELAPDLQEAGSGLWGQLYWKWEDLRSQWEQRRLRKRGWYDLSARCDDPAIFIGGCGRSGTTVLREMLIRHSQFYCGPETSMFGLPFNIHHLTVRYQLQASVLRQQVEAASNLVAFASQFFRHYMQEKGKTRWGDKTPNNVRGIERILTCFPNARFIHVLRDGRDVCCSLRHHPKFGVRYGKVVPLNINRPIKKCAQRWLNDTTCGLAFRGHPRVIEVRYEDMVQQPQAVLQRICDFTQLAYEPAMLDPNHGQDKTLLDSRLRNNRNATSALTSSSKGRWVRDLNPQERKDFVNVAGELLIALGYARSHDWVNQMPETATS